MYLAGRIHPCVGHLALAGPGRTRTNQYSDEEAKYRLQEQRISPT